MADDVTPFHLAVPQADLDDLRARLRAARWPERETVDDDSQGVQLADLQALCRYWADGYDWRIVEDKLNAAGQFRTRVEGLGIHFLHVRSSHPDALPLVITHGWPGSIVEFLDVLEPLTDPPAHGADAADAFHVVCPSLPGYGWSDKPARTGWGIERIAGAWAELMRRLGYDRYGAVGSDWGTSISASLGQHDAGRVAGAHLMPPLAPPDPESLGSLSDREQAALEAMSYSAQRDSGYSTEHRTRPQTIGYSLVDSPAGLAAWITEKMRGWIDPASDLSVDQILDNVMLYWLPSTGASSARLYWESLDDVTRWIEGPLEARDVVDVPTGCTIFPHELQRPSRRWAERRFRDIRYWSEPDRGGHFPALEHPALFVEEVRAFFRLVR
jgi:pimeloyl-ACP methyl ester carboxylesterase